MIGTYLETIEKDLESKTPDRHEELLGQIASFVADEIKSGKPARLNFICTHNSRRSQLAQAWCSLVQSWMGLEAAESYSGGTEVTACNERTIAALKRAGCSVSKEGSENPVYWVTAEDANTEVKLWSKVYDDETNPGENFAAVMTCDHADANCPFIPGAAKRFPLTYTDPKYADDTAEETDAYDRACKIIATDMIRLFKKVKKLA
jgi:arsenate reductase (thioredoxin)